MNVLSFVVFAVLQILFLPFAILGVVIVGYRQMVMSKRLGTSQTAIETLNGRGTMHVFGMRDDEVAARIASVLPNTSTFGLWLCLFLYSTFKGASVFMSFGLFEAPSLPSNTNKSASINVRRVVTLG